MFGFSGNRKWVYTHSVKGRFQRLHRWSGRLLHLLLLATPWIPIHGHPAVRIDVPTRQVYALGVLFTASDGFLLLLIALFAVFSLFLFTSLYGRLWCGYACPQTVFLEEWIRPLERLVEGERGQRMQRDKHPWTFDWAWRKAVKFTLFGLVAFGVSMAFMSFFAGGPELWTGRARPGEYALVGIFALGWFADFAWFREQLCNYLCPYARFQSALTDRESLLVAYDKVRGEPRGRPAAKTEGGCIDCGKCVAVCPQGIDIRNGFQLECVTCGRCIDACDAVMGKLGQPSLVGYSTLVQTDGGQPRRLRPRTVVYGGLLAAVGAAMLVLVLGHGAFEATVARSPGSLYTVDADGWIRNTFMLRLANNDVDDEPDAIAVRVEGLDEAQVVVPEIVLSAEERRTVPLVVRIPPERARQRTIPFRVRVEGHDSTVVRDATFKTPGS